MARYPQPKIFISEDEIPEKFKELLWIVHQLRERKKIWEERYGADNRNKLRVWEEKADQFLEKYLKFIESNNDGPGEG